MKVTCINLNTKKKVVLDKLRPNSTVRALKAWLSVEGQDVCLFLEETAGTELCDFVGLKRSKIIDGSQVYFKYVSEKGEKKSRRLRDVEQPSETKEEQKEVQAQVTQEDEQEFRVDLSYNWREEVDLDELEKAWGDLDTPLVVPQEDGESKGEAEEDIPMTAPPTLMRQRSYVVMGNVEISQLQKNTLDAVAQALDVDSSRGVMILRAFDWDGAKAIEAWKKDKEGVMKTAGITEEAETKTEAEESQDQDEEVDCGFCFTPSPFKDTFALNCGHRYCNDCWEGWCNASFDKGQECVFTECPFGTVKNKCRELIPPTFMQKNLEKKKSQKFAHWLRLAFVKQNVYIKWCPRPGCDKAVEYKKKGMKRVQCACSYTFCFGCGLEDHEPAPCTAMKEWMTKNSAESGIFKWLKDNAKSEDVKTCTKCHIVIQKNQGCKHMTCRNCRHEFCWLCFQDWRGHDSAMCTRFVASKTADKKKAEEMKGDEEGDDFRRYQFYHARWENYKQAVEFGLKTKEKAESRMEALQNMKGTGLATVKFLMDAIDVVIDCRKLLEWSYVWCYYLKDKDSMMALFRNHLNNLEDITEDLGMLVEQPLDKLMLDSSRTAVINKSRVLTKYRRNIVDFAREHGEHVKEQA